MCGIAGIFAYRESAAPVHREELLRIREHMVRRGPDGAGLWMSDDRRVGLAHRRLAIIDLSEAGAQPMASADGRFHVTFNGEIYNYRELRRELEGRGFAFRSNSDTEVLLHLYADRGAAMVDALRGIFAFALWDSRDRTLFLARDHFGVKPLYYADDGKTLRFASQVKALRAGGAIADAPAPAGAVGFLLLGAVPEPWTMFRDIRSLPAGATLSVREGGAAGIDTYFDVREALCAAQDAPRPNREDTQRMLTEAVRDAVRANLVADVPVGVFLSAGIDSGTITGIARDASASDLRTLTLGFDEYRGTPADEVPLAEDVARRHGTRHETHRIGRDDFMQELPAILEAMDQPSIDGVNTYLVSRAAARSGMRVALSGLGGDEMFGGYPSFRQVPRSATLLGWSRNVRWLGKGARAALAPLVGRFTSPKYAGLLEYGGSTGGAYLLRRSLFMPWELDAMLDPATSGAGVEELDIVRRLDAAGSGIRSSHARVAALEMAWYMRNQLLRDADWAGMAHSLEVRVPLIDVNLFRALAPALTGAAPPTKAELARTPREPLPEPVIARAKSGFTTPVRDWVESERGVRARGLRGWARRVLPQRAKSLRVLALVTDAFGGNGGIAKFNRDLVSAIAAMPHCAEIVVLPRLISRPIGNVPKKITVIVGAARGKIRYVAELARALATGRFDIVLIGHINLAAVGILAASIKRARSVLVVHGIDAWTPHRSRWVRRSIARTDRIVGVSQLTLDRLASWAKVDPTVTFVLPNCVDLEQFQPGPKPADLVQALGLHDRVVLMTLGRLASEERYKGFDEIIEALPALARDIPSLSYLVCGDGPDRDRLVAKAKEFGVSQRVVFTGFVPEERKVDYYRLADAYVMPSRGEGFGIVYLEAAACGVPVMGSRLDGSREALLDGRLGELTDPNDSQDVRAGVLRTLARSRTVSPDLQRFSVEAFRARVAVLVAAICDGSGDRQASHAQHAKARRAVKT